MANDPLAIIGISCRFPGGITTPETFWRFLMARSDGIGPVPEDRKKLWQLWGTPRLAMTNGGFLEAIDRFDAPFFNLSPREARHIDPQHRLLLELAWEAFDDAGYPGDRRAGSKTGVFIGIYLDEYWDLQRYLYPESIDAYTNTGGTMSIAANRISYTFDLRGPSLSVDTACSSSLTALYLACQSVRSGECEVALAGGVNLLLTPQTSLGFEQAAMLAPDGRCKAFDAAADGYGRSDGAGMVLIKPLQKALDDGDSVYAVIRGAAINQDGRTAGMTIPRVDAQVAVIGKACQDAGIEPGELFYVEAHGTGTPAGDPVEALAIGLATGPALTCYIGSVKTGIGHTEAAAGIAGVIKTALALKHGILPPNLHFETPNPAIPFEQLNLKVVTEAVVLPGPICAGVNSFGFGGANAHIVLASPPVDVAPDQTEQAPYVLPLSGHTAESLKIRAGTIARWLETTQVSLADVTATAGIGRSHQNHRLAVVCSNRPAVIADLSAFANGKHPDGLAVGMVPSELPPLIYILTGMGPQHPEMGKTLYRTEPVYRNTVEQVDALFFHYTGWSVVEESLRPAEHSRMDETTISQPANFMLQMGLAALLAGWGLRPDLVIGHSVGEIAAACIAGIITLETAVRICYHRSRLQADTAGRGGMLAVGLRAEEAQDAIRDYQDRIAVAAINSPISVTLSGDTAVISLMAQRFERMGVFCRRLLVDVAYHSAQMDELREPFLQAIGDTPNRMAESPMISTVTGAPVGPGQLTPEYWWANIREPVLFHAACGHLPDHPGTALLQIGPHPVLALALLENLPHFGKSGISLPTLQRDRPERESLYNLLSQLYARGRSIDWEGVYPGRRNRVALPPYTWQKESHWFDLSEQFPNTPVRPLTPLLGGETPSATEPGVRIWTTTISERRFPYLSDHRINGRVVVPAAHQIEMALEVMGTGVPVTLENLIFPAPLVVDRGEGYETQLIVSQSSELTLFSRLIGDGTDSSGWIKHLAGRYSGGSAPDSEQTPAPVVSDAPPENGTDFYERAWARGYHYGPLFQCVRDVRRTDGQVTLRLEVPEGVGEPSFDYRIVPTLLDGAIQALLAVLPEDGRVYAPAAVESLTLYASPQGRGPFLVHATGTEDTTCGDVRLYDGSGSLLLVLKGLQLEPIGGSVPVNASEALFEERWIPWYPADSPVDSGNRQVLIVGEAERVGEPPVAPPGRHFSYTQAALPTDSEVEVPPCEGDSSVTDVLFIVPAVDRDHLETSLGALLTVVQRLIADSNDPMPRLWLVTSGAQEISITDPIAPWQAPFWGLGRVIALEHPELRTVLIDLPSVPREADRAALFRLLDVETEEMEIGVRNGSYTTRRLKPMPLHDIAAAVRPSDRGSGRYYLTAFPTGSLENMQFRAGKIGRPGPGEVALRVLATGLNFRDVLTALGLLPVPRNTFPALGWECAGEVVEIGDGVTHVKPGDVVIGLSPGSFSSHIVLDARLVWPKPTNISTVEAATLPLAFLTASYGLEYLARLQPGERVLIHSASGGVGLAAIQVAKLAGADVFATAGTPEKRAYLSTLGITFVADSRSVAFADEILKVTEGKGVDIILNSLSGTAMYRSLSLLAPYGRFIELGKTDFLAGHTVSLNRFERNISYHSVDLSFLRADRPDLLDRLVSGLVKRIEAGALKPMPCVEFPIQQAHDAFRIMAAAKHIGKIVVTANDRLVPVRLSDDASAIRRDGAYLITGGTGGIGRLLVKWLLGQGTRCLVVTGREAESPEQTRWLGLMRENGADLHYVPSDAADQDGVHRLIRRFGTEWPVLRGVFHVAGLLDDGILLRYNGPRMKRILAPKVYGAWHLHECTRAIALDFFVLFSSSSGLIGVPGQAAYAAANAFLDGLASYRRTLGLPAVSIAWGPWRKIGMTTNPQLSERLEAQGFELIAADMGLETLNRILRQEIHRVAVIPNNPSQLRYPEHRRLLSDERWEMDESEREVVLDPANLSALPAEKKRDYLYRFLRGAIARVVELPIQDIDTQKTWRSLGVDSLMAVELKHRIERGLGVSLPVEEFLAAARIEASLEKIADRLGPSSQR